MKKHIYIFRLLVIIPAILISFLPSLQAQFEFKIQYQTESNDSTWGVYVRPIAGFAAGSNDAVTGSGQVTILMKNDGFDSLHNIQSVNGTWNATYDFVRGPCEAPDITYIFVGLNDGDGITYEDGEETLLFTFQVPAGCPDSLGLFDNNTDPFRPDNPSNSACWLGPGRNSVGNNPGQDLSVFNSSTGMIYNWGGNFASFAFSCGDCDGDGVVDGLEDTNGDGVFTPGIDSSAVCDVCDPNGINNFSATISGADTLSICGAIGEDSVALFVNTTGGWSPFTVIYEGWNDNATFQDTVTNYTSGDPIFVSPDTTTQYRIVTIRDTPPNMDSVMYCEISADSLFDTVRVVIEGPLSIDAGGHPQDVTSCSLDTLGFGIDASNGGAGIIEYQWQVSSDDTNWADVINGTPYAFADTDSLIITNPLGLDGLYYRAKVFTTACDTIYSNSAQLGVDGPFVVDVVPQDQFACGNEDPVFFHTETNVGQGVFNRRWQVSTDNGLSWSDVVISGIYSTNSTTQAGGAGIQSIYFDTLFINTPTASMDQYQYRLAAVGQNSSLCSEILSQAATLTVEGPITIDVAPVDVSICSDTVACFGVSVNNASLSGTLQYQWYVQERGSALWTALTNDGTYSGTRSDTLCVTDVLGRDSFSYRVEVQTSECAIVTSGDALLRVDGPISFGTSADDVTVCASEDATFFAFETFMGQGVLDRRWQVSTDNGLSWSDVAISGIYSVSSDSTSNPIAGFEIVYYDTLFINTPTFNMNQWQYRVAATGQNSNNCVDIFSREATLTVEGALSFTVQPQDVELCSDTAACFGVSINNEANEGVVAYQWYVKERGQSIWQPLSSSDGSYGGVRSDTLCVNFITGRDSFLYRVGIQTNQCAEVFSDSAILRVDGPISIVNDPDDVTVCAEEDATFFASESTIGQGGLNTRWELSTDNGSSWSTLSTGGIYTIANRVEANASLLIDSTYYDTLYIDQATASMDGYLYRMVATGDIGSGCEDVPTDEARLEVEGRISITVQPVSVSICSDTAACFGVSVNNETPNGNIQYQWQVQPVGQTNWINLSSNTGVYGGVTSDTLCINNTEGLDGFHYRVYISTEQCANVFSDSAQLSVSGPIEFDSDPQDVTVCAAEDATFFNAETSIGQGGLTNRWQVSTDDGNTWNDVNLSDPIYTATSSKEENASPVIDSTYYDTLFLASTITALMDGWQYRIVANGLNGTSCKDITSTSATLTVNGPLSIVAAPASDTICSGDPATFEVQIGNASSGDVRYQWQKKTTIGTWIDLVVNSTYNGVRDSILSISDVASVVATDGGIDSAFFRVGIFTNNCDIIYSDSAQLRVEGPFIFNVLEDSPHDTVVCAGEQVIFNAAPVNEGLGNMTFEWKVSRNGGNFGPIAGLGMLGTFSGENTTQLILNPTVDDRAILDSTFFRLDVFSENCGSASSSLRALLRVDGVPQFDLQPQDTVNCADKGVIFFVNVSNDGFGGQQALTFRWQELTKGSSTWQDIQNGGVYNGANTDTLSIDVTSSLDSNQYRVIVWSSVCFRDTSDAALLIEEGSVSYSSNPEDVIICSGEATSFDVTMINSTGQGTNLLNWQISTNNGISWSNIDTSQVKDGLKLFTVSQTAPVATGDSTATSINSILNISDVEGMQGYRFRTAAASTFCDSTFSQLARLTVEGPFSATLTGNTNICSNVGTTITANVVNQGAGLPNLRWQYMSPDSTNFIDIPTTWGIFQGEESNGIGDKVLRIDSVLSENSRANLPSGVDTLWSLHNYQFRLSIVSDTCEVAVFSDTFTLTIIADTTGTCDWDLDGLDNITDLDDDNDGLTDSIEVYITTGPGSEPQDSIAQFDTDTDNNGVTDDQEDADGDTISNGEEVDDDDGDTLADGIDPATGVFDGNPAAPNPLFEDADDIFNGDPLDPCDPILSPSCIGVVLDVNVKLQGAMPALGFEQNDGVLMGDDLRSNSLLPKDSPYEKFFVLDSLNSFVPAFVHVKRDSILEEIPSEDSTAIFGANGRYGSDPGNAVVDWVFVELRSGIKLDSVVTTRAALLQRDGDVRDHRVQSDPRRVDSDGYAYLSFDSTLAGEYYVVIRHRNHLGVMTNEAGLYSPIVTKVDFTDPDFNALGTHPMRMNADSTEQYMWAGDISSDRRIIFQGPGNDVDEIFFRVISNPDNTDFLSNFIVSGYYRTDYNLDGRSIFQGPNNDRQMLIFQSILQFPDNQIKFLANYVILEQLP